jgi:DNA invertase Pin-like site-specific DNA recombinase
MLVIKTLNSMLHSQIPNAPIQRSPEYPATKCSYQSHLRVAHMGDLLEQIEAKGAGLVILSMSNERVDTSTATGKLILNMMVSVPQFERGMMKERQVEGIKRAQAEGKYKGRVPKAMNQADKVKALVAAGVDRVKIQEQLGMSMASHYRCLKVA